MKTTSKPPETSLQDTITLVNAFLDNCRARGLSKETLRWYSDFLLKFAAQYPELPDSPEPLEQFIYHFQSSDSRRHGAYRAVRSFYNWCERRYSINNPMKATTAPKVKPTERPALTMEQLKKLLEYPYQSNLTKALLFFLADTGCRIGEAATLHSDNIYDNSVKVKGKTGERIIPISHAVREMIIGLGTGLVFKYSNRVLSDRVIKAGRLAGVKVCPHDLRRTFATNWRGSDLSLKYIGGWASWRMVEHYSQRKLDKAQEDHKVHSPVAMINPAATKVPASGKPPAVEDAANMDTIIKLAEQLGAAKQTGSQPARVRVVPELPKEELVPISDLLPADWQEFPELIETKRRALYYFRCVAFNICDRLAHIYRGYARQGRLNPLNLPYIAKNIDDENDEKEKEYMHNDAEFFWGELAKIAKRAGCEQYIEATKLQDQELIGEWDPDNMPVDMNPLLWGKGQFSRDDDNQH